MSEDEPERWKNPCLEEGEPLKSGHLGGTSTHGDPYTWYPKLWDWIVSELHISTLLDVGCGVGHALKYFSDLGIDAEGVDGYEECLKQSVYKNGCYIHDYTTGIFLPDKKYNMVYASEFLEHIEEKYLGNVLHTLNFATDYLCLSPALPGVGGHHHVNCQPQTYWEEKIKSIGFVLDKELTLEARALTDKVNNLSYFHNNGLIFVRD